MPHATGINYLMRVGLFFHAYDGAAFALARLTANAGSLCKARATCGGSRAVTPPKTSHW